jgi:hypothetical protein
MEISEEEINYISKIYQHGINHLVDDSIPNRLICIHNLHWCVEYLLRKATKDYRIDYKAGFEKIFKAFTGKKSVPKDLEKSIFKLNTVRNNMEHREIYTDIIVIRKIIPNVEKFIKWILKIVFNTSIDLRSISSADIEEIFEDFSEWQDGKLASNWLNTSIERSEIYDYLFICLIPATYSPNLVDLAFDGVNEMKTSKSELGVFFSVPNPDHKSKIEQYFRTFRHLFDGGAQVYTISTHLRYYNDYYGNEMKIYPDGRIYICYEYRHLDKKNPKLNMSMIYEKIGTRYILNN